MKSAAHGVSRGGGWLATTGAHIIMFLTFVAMTALGLGRMLARRGRGTTLGAQSFD